MGELVTEREERVDLRAAHAVGRVLWVRVRVRTRVRVRARARVRFRVRASVRVRVRASVRARVS